MTSSSYHFFDYKKAEEVKDLEMEHKVENENVWSMNE